MTRPLRSPRSLRVLAVGAALALTAGCGSAGTGGQDGTGTVRVGVIPIVDVAPIYLGKEQGFFADRGIELALESGQGGAAIVPGVVSGQFQFGFSNVTSLLLARSKGLPLKVVAAGNSTTGDAEKDFGAVVVPADSDITDAAGLAGRTVAVNTANNIGDTTIREVVRQAGGDPTTIKFVELPFPDMPAAVQQHRVDAAWVVEPFLTVTTRQGARPVAANFAGTDPELMVAAYFTSQQLIDSDPDLVQRFTEAMNESLRYARDHPDEARRILGTYTQIDAETAASLTLPRWPTEINVASIQRLADLAVRDGLITKEPNVRDLLR
ncbi:NitT/TauT family transport system substrate-binding protein [Amycolatopsis arida]|uniref:NitT/TauT family transport system substrate-binding protein n=1 Tax=Amycolatopsis arida TaxID=587909 RepID=A0A1I5MEL6_9PSEU|nr:ABC transporter substrate-binding protein [Amycolatopsis arida]TDX94061.1 NitT/TauT family transport system substrate-binding protein [Amycolatopsis arida]SFP07757.1 NitT/TauT family transport system substrate-binding protein [Amycolatopsis arida]